MSQRDYVYESAQNLKKANSYGDTKLGSVLKIFPPTQFQSTSVTPETVIKYLPNHHISCQTRTED